MLKRNRGTIIGAILGVIGAVLALVMGGFIGVSFQTDDDNKPKKKKRYPSVDDDHADGLDAADIPAEDVIDERGRQDTRRS